jgi:type I restriction enzyme S subunit
MSSDSTKLKIRECLLQVIDNRGKTPPLSSFKTPHGLIEVNALVGKKKYPEIESVKKYVSEETYESWFRSGHPIDGDILFSTVGSIAEVAIFRGGGGCIAQNLIALRTNPRIIYSDYFYYSLINPSVQTELRSLDISSVQPSIKVPHLLSIEIPVLNLALQKKIVQILCAIDDRITILRETNKTLESIAQAIFKSWFVDFDPVHSKAKGIAPEGMDEATAALFPDSFEETELGMVPKGWTLGLMSDFMRLHKGTINPGQHPDKLYQHFSLPAFDDGKRPVLELGAEIKSNKTSVPVNAVLVSKLNPRTPRIWLPSSLEKDAICSTEFLPFVPFGNGTTSFIYCKLLDPFFSDTVAQFVTGTSNSHQRIRPDTVLSLSTVVPSSGPVMSFDDIAAGIFSRVKINEQQAQNLSDLRDTLLPRLISGQLRIEEAQEMVGSV